MRNLLAAPLVLVFALLAPAPASAVTVSEIVSLSKAGVSEQVILALIDRDKTIFSLPAEELVTLQKAGLSDAILIAMLKSGRQEQPVAAQVEAPPPHETEPPIVVAGPEPDQPSGGQNNATAAQAAPAAVPYFVPVPYLVPITASQTRCVVASTTSRADGSAPTGMFFLHPTHGQFFPNPPPASVVQCASEGPRQARRR